MSSSLRPGAEAVATKGWVGAHKWLLLRRATQAAVLILFLVGPWFGLWVVKGNLNYSLTLGVVPLADPFVLLQSILAGNAPERLAIIGVVVVVLFYALVGGRVFCSWVCPVNLVTDFAAWLRARIGIKGGAHVSRQVRYWILAMALALALATGTLAWELVNPVSMLHRGLIFGLGAAWTVVLAVFLLDLFVMNRAWCGHFCPTGAFYSLLAVASPLRVTAIRREQCNDCMDCFAVCPEHQVIRPALKGASQGAGPTITSMNCTNCGRCIDVCSKDVFEFGVSVTRRNKVAVAAGNSSVAGG